MFSLPPDRGGLRKRGVLSCTSVQDSRFKLVCNLLCQEIMRHRGVSGRGKSLLLAAVLAAGVVNLSAYKSPSPHGSHSYGQSDRGAILRTLFQPAVPPVVDYLARSQPPVVHLLRKDPSEGGVALSEKPSFIEPRPSLEEFLAYLEEDREAPMEEEETVSGGGREAVDPAAAKNGEDPESAEGATAEAEEMRESMLEERAEALRVETSSRLVPRLFPAPDRRRLQRDWLHLYFPVNDGPGEQQSIIVPVPYDSIFMPPGQEGMRSRATIRQEP